MTMSRDPDRLIRAFLAERRSELPDHVYDAVREEIDHTHQRVVGFPWGLPYLNRFQALGVAAVVLALALYFGAQLFGGRNLGGPGPAATPTPLPTPTSTPQEPTPLQTSAEGAATFVVHMEGARPFLQPYGATVTLPPYYGWKTDGPMAIATGSAGGFGAWTISGIYPDPCHWEGVQTEALPLHGATHYAHIDQVAAMLARQPGRNPSELTHLEVGGLSATRIELSLPSDIAVGTCDGGRYRSWDDPTGLGGPGYRDCGGCDPLTLAREAVYILDIDRGVVLVDIWSYPGMTSDGAQASLNSVLTSLLIDFE
jgi:hypothetical protein